MRQDIRDALVKGGSSNIEDRTIDITTIGRRSGQPRRIEICFYRFADETYLSGIPAPRTRDWLLNLEAELNFTFHFKHGLVADLPAVASVIIDPVERRRVFADFVADFSRRNGANGPWPSSTVDEWVEHSPLAKVTFVASDA